MLGAHGAAELRRQAGSSRQLRAARAGCIRGLRGRAVARPPVGGLAGAACEPRGGTRPRSPSSAHRSLPRKSADSHTGPTTSNVCTSLVCGAVNSMCWYAS